MVDFEEHILISFLLPRFQDCQEVQNKPNNKPGAKVVTKVTMHADGWAPDIVVGIDFGMTCTGVAYSRGPNWPEPRTLQHWPGKMINELANKVPTLLQYTPGSTFPTGWGFGCDPENLDLVELFKLHLDPAFRGDPRPDAPTLQQAQQWFQDYLRGIHDHIAITFSDSIPRWRNQKAEFVFSVPTTWKNPSMIAEIERLIKNAGFGSDGASPGAHRATIGLTEAEAAAVYASKQQYEKDDVVLVCDAGGGTTDVNVLKLLSSGAEPTRLQQLSWVDGRPIGSTSIDMGVHRLIVKRLSLIQHQLAEDLEAIADQMMVGRFERFKCMYGTPLSEASPELLLAVPGLQPGFTNPNAMIQNSMMSLSRFDLKEVFDEQVVRILSLTDEQLDKVAHKSPGTEISYLILSGGFGSSAYVKARLRSHYATGPGSSKPGVRRMEIATVAEPQLAVVQGLVMDRIQSLSHGNEIFAERCCRLSYGIICKEKYNPGLQRHVGRPIVKDPWDGNTWVENQIVWFIKQGESVSSDGVMKPFTINRNPGQEFEVWQTKIVMSTLPWEKLPTNTQAHGANRLCEVSSVLKNQEVDMKLKNRHWYSMGTKYWRFRFDIKVLLGAADLKFVLLTKDKRVISKDHDAIEVVWQAATEHVPDSANNTMPLYTAAD